ncbi:MAG: VPLPA-CTERM sorting domain-containing protein [Gammaproteobacteria bacterium]
MLVHLHRSLFAATLAVAIALPAENARAVSFPGGTSDGRFIVAIAGVLTGLFLPLVEEARREAALRGDMTLDLQQIATRANNFEAGGRAAVQFADILDFDLVLTLPTDAVDGAANVRLTPRTGAVEVINAGWFTDGENVMIDSTGLPPGAPVLQFTIDTFDRSIGFPNGRRVGDDVTDIVLAQLFTGSVNFGVAALTDGFGGEPAFVGSTQLTPDAAIVFGRNAAIAPVPLPASVPLLLGGLGVLLAIRQRTGNMRRARAGSAAGDPA